VNKGNCKKCAANDATQKSVVLKSDIDHVNAATSYLLGKLTGYNLAYARQGCSPGGFSLF
jgi:hypothetical protein